MTPQSDQRDYVDNDEFVAAVKPYADAILAQALAGLSRRISFDDVTASGSLPAADSLAVSELAEQKKWSGIWDATPIDTAHSVILMLTNAAEDAMRSFAALIVSEHTPIFAHDTLSRAALEYCSLAYYLSDPMIDARERTRRVLNERLYSAWEQARLPEEANPEPKRQDRLLTAGAKLGCTSAPSRKGSVPYLHPPRPKIGDRIKELLGNERLGAVVYSHGSAVAHGTMWGIFEVVEPPSPMGAGPDPVVGRIGIGVQDVGRVFMTMALAHRRTYDRLRGYMGWIDDPGWITARDQAVDLAQRHLTGVSAMRT